MMMLQATGTRHAAPSPLGPSEAGGKLPKGGAAGVVEGVGVVVGQYEVARDRLAGQLREVEATLVDQLHRLPPPTATSSSTDRGDEGTGEGLQDGHGDATQHGSGAAAATSTTTSSGAGGSSDGSGGAEVSFEEQFRSINAKLLSAEERIKRKTSFAKAATSAAALDPHDGPSGGGATVSKAEYDELEEEKTKIEEELWELKFQYEEEQRKVFALTSEKEALEQYVTQLAEEMQKETANMVSMKEQFEEQASPAGRRSVSRNRTSRGGASPEGATITATADADGDEAASGAAGRGHGSTAMMDADTLAVELALKDEELSRLRDSIERERRKMEGEIVSLKFDLQKVRNEVNVREGKMASIKLELEKGRKRVEAIELERRTLEQEAARATEAAAESDRLRAEAENAERAARAECEEFSRRVAVADAEVARLRDVHEEATRALAAQAQAVGGTNREAIRQVEERVGLLRQEWERLRENERNLTNVSVDTGAGVDADHGARWAVEEFVRELQGRVGRLEREKEEEKALQREVKDELHRRIRKLERERDDERERTREALDRARGLDDQLRAAVDAAERERADRRRAEEASAQLGERLAQYEALGRGEVERGQHLFLDREKELRQAVEERESQRRKIEAEVIMLRVELQRVQAQAAEAGSLAAELADVRGQLAQAKLESHQREVEHQAKVEGLEERMRVWEERHDPQAREREVEEARAKDRRIAQLTAELAAQAQLVASQQEMHENSLQALKTQNSLLSRELERLEDQQTEMAKEKDETSQHLQGELQSLRQAYKTLLQQHGPNSPSTARRDQEKDAALSSLREELDNVKRDLFYTTAVGIKLNLTYSGRSCNINIGSLYEKALAEGVKWQQWNRWIHDQAERRQ